MVTFSYNGNKPCLCPLGHACGVHPCIALVGKCWASRELCCQSAEQSWVELKIQVADSRECNLTTKRSTLTYKQTMVNLLRVMMDLVLHGHVPHGRHGYRQVSSVWYHQTDQDNASGTMTRTGQCRVGYHLCSNVDSTNNRKVYAIFVFSQKLLEFHYNSRVYVSMCIEYSTFFISCLQHTFYHWSP